MAYRCTELDHLSGINCMEARFSFDKWNSSQSILGVQLVSLLYHYHCTSNASEQVLHMHYLLPLSFPSKLEYTDTEPTSTNSNTKFLIENQDDSIHHICENYYVDGCAM